MALVFSVSIVMALGISRRSLSKRSTGAASGLPCGACVRCFMLVLQFVLVRGVQSGVVHLLAIFPLPAHPWGWVYV